MICRLPSYAFSSVLGMIAAGPTFLEAQSAPPSIVFVISDALRADHVSCINKDHQPPTVHLDKLAKRGTLFVNAISQGPFTRSAMGSVFTGLYPSEHKGYEGLLPTNSPVGATRTARQDFFVAKDAPDLFSILANRGYTTTCVTENYDPRSHGMDVPDIRAYQGQDASRLVTAAIQYIQRRPTHYFLYLHFADPHRPYDTARKLDASSPGDIRSPDPHANFLGHPLSVANKLYSLEIQDIDNQMGRFIEFLDKTSFFDKNILIFSSDHGEYFNERKKFHSESRPMNRAYFLDHGFSLYQELIHVPLMIVGPSIIEGNRVIEEFVETRWLFNFITGVAGVETSNPLLEIVQGVSRKPRYCLSEGVGGDHMMALAMDIGELKAIISPDGYKLIYDVENKQIELYNLLEDPGEKTNLALASEYEERIKDLMKVLGRQVDLSLPFIKVEGVRLNTKALKTTAKIARVSVSAATSGPEHQGPCAFDGDPHSFWEVGGGYPQWIGIELSQVTTVTQYTLLLGGGGERMPKAWRLEASNDGVRWAEIDRQSGQTDWAINERREYEIVTPGAYRFYRLAFVEGNDPILRLYEVELTAVASSADIERPQPGHRNVDEDYWKKLRSLGYVR